MPRLETRTIPLSVQANVPLKPFTTFKIGGPARHFVEIHGADHAQEAIRFAADQDLPLFILGGGSNILVSDRGVEAVVLHPMSRGNPLIEERENHILVRIAAGDRWDGAVEWTVTHGYWGIENLSHIPGLAGAAVVQNIGAYGQQLSDVLENVVAMNLETGVITLLNAKDCRLGYRKSLFNTTDRGCWLILALTLRLQKKEIPNLMYPDLANWFRDQPRPSLDAIRAAVIAIRDGKFPFPRQEKGGNAGSFFKNLLLNEIEYENLQLAVSKNFDLPTLGRLHELRRRFTSGAAIKIPSAFLIETCGLKGFRLGGAQVNESQPLVLLNQGGATADDVMSLARHVRQTVFQRTSMVLPLEPELVGFTPAELQSYMALDPA